MKNLKKVLALVVALTMVLGTVAFAGYTDVAEDAAEYTAVSTLSSLNILTGFEDGSFQPDGDITRAQFAAVVCRALGASVSGNAVTGFSDVASDHWASGYIAYVAGQKIVNGMGDGTFAPEANVTFEQAVKMLVVALGFEPMAAQKGGYPTGYMVIANTYEMTKGINVADQTAPASRGVVAQLTYNALDIPMMEQTGFGSQTEYTVQDGTNNKAYKTLLTGLDVAKLDGVVETTPRYDVNLPKDQVMFEIRDSYKNVDWTEKTGYPKGSTVDNQGNVNYNAIPLTVAEGVNVNDYFQIASTIYVKKLTNSKSEIIAIMPGADSEIVSVDIADIEIDAAQTETNNTQITYYPSASSTKTQRYRLATTVDFYFNYAQKYNLYSDILRDNADKDVEIDLIDNNGDGRYDAVIAKKYEYDIVDEINVDKNRFTAKKSGKTFAFDFEDDEKDIKIFDANGDAMDLADFKEGDVVAYAASGNSTSAYNWIEVINLGESSVTGTVDETADYDSATQIYGTLYIDGTEYDNVSDDTINLGDEGAFYLTRNGKIFKFDKSASASNNYGYILNAATASTGFTNAWQVKMLTKDGIVLYTVRDGVKVNNVQFNEDGTPKTGTATFPLEAFDNQTKGISFKDVITGSEAASSLENRVVTFKLDSNNKLKEINQIAATDRADSNGAPVEYNADSQKLGKALEDDTIIFNIDVQSEDSAAAYDINYLVDEGEYEYIVYKNSDAEWDCVVIVDGETPIDYSNGIAVVTSVTDITLEDGVTEAKKITYYGAGNDDVATATIVDETDISLPVGCSLANDVVPGAFMYLTVGEDGIASAYTVIAKAETDKQVAAQGNVYTIVNGALDEFVKANDKETGFVAGYLKDWKSKNGKFIFDVELKDEVVYNTAATQAPFYTHTNYTTRTMRADVALSSVANAYTFNTRGNKVDLTFGDWQGVENIDKYADVYNNNVLDTTIDTVTPFFAITVDGDIVDFITFGTRVTVPTYDVHPTQNN